MQSLTAKITRATLKSFVRKFSDTLQIDVRSEFDGQIDGLEWKKDGFRHAVRTSSFPNNTLGYKGIWLCLSSPDHYRPYMEGGMIGIEVSNCCGNFIVAVPIA